MSIYTTQVRYICEMVSGLGEGKTPIEYCEAARSAVFDFDTGLLGVELRNNYLRDLLLHYYTREICEETYGLWKLRLQQKCADITPFYNELIERYREYGGKNLFDDVMYTINKTGTFETAKSGSDAVVDDTFQTQTMGGEDIITSNKGRWENSLGLYSDTPQGGIEGLITVEETAGFQYKEKPTDDTTKDSGDFEGFKVGKYLTNANANKGNRKELENETTAYGKTNTNDYDNTRTTTYGSKTTDTDNRKETVTGKKGDKSYAEMFKEVREQILNIKLQFIEEFEDCFMQIF